MQLCFVYWDVSGFDTPLLGKLAPLYFARWCALARFDLCVYVCFIHPLGQTRLL